MSISPSLVLVLTMALLVRIPFNLLTTLVRILPRKDRRSIKNGIAEMVAMIYAITTRPSVDAETEKVLPRGLKHPSPPSLQPFPSVHRWSCLAILPK